MSLQYIQIYWSYLPDVLKKNGIIDSIKLGAGTIIIQFYNYQGFFIYYVDRERWEHHYKDTWRNSEHKEIIFEKCKSVY